MQVANVTKASSTLVSADTFTFGWNYPKKDLCAARSFRISLLEARGPSRGRGHNKDTITATMRASKRQKEPSIALLSRQKSTFHVDENACFSDK
jgi:hypothetical protein